MRDDHDPTSIDRVAIVTGGSRCLGREIARRLAGRGYAVVVGYARHQRDADAVVEDILAAGGIALTARADVADEVDLERLFAETAAAFGGVDVVVHAAGRTLPGPVADYDLAAFDELQRVNVRGAFVVNQWAARRLHTGGAIVNLSSAAVRLASPTYAAYAASKAAVETLTRVLARELRGRDITVNAVASGLEPSPTAAEVAGLVAFLAGSEGRLVSGQVIPAPARLRQPSAAGRAHDGVDRPANRHPGA